MRVLSLFSGCGGMDIGFEGDFLCLKRSINTQLHPDWIIEDRGNWVKVKKTPFQTVFANDIRPGLTGWAQIHGRDELEIDTKAKLDGYYVQHMSFWMDVKCFFGTIVSVLRSDGVVEGGTGTIHKNEKNNVNR